MAAINQFQAEWMVLSSINMDRITCAHTTHTHTLIVSSAVSPSPFPAFNRAVMTRFLFAPWIFSFFIHIEVFYGHTCTAHGSKFKSFAEKISNFQCFSSIGPSNKDIHHRKRNGKPTCPPFPWMRSKRRLELAMHGQKWNRWTCDLEGGGLTSNAHEMLETVFCA